MRTWLYLGLTLSLLGCGGDGGTDGGGTDGGGTDAGDGMPVDVVFEVQDSVDQTPIAGATLAWDAPGGTRVEGVSDAMGRITVSADWALGLGAATVHADGHVLLSIIDLGADWVSSMEAGGVVPIRPARMAPERVTVSGTFLNTTDDTHFFLALATVPGGVAGNAMGPDFELEVPAGVPFQIYGQEYTFARASPTEVTAVVYAAAVIDVPAATADVAGLEIDLSSPVTITTVDGSLEAPGMGTPLADGIVYANVFTEESGFANYLGAMTSSAPNMTDPNTIDFTISYYEHATETPLTRYSLRDEPNFSAVTVAGYPSAGPQGISFPPPPEIITPAFGVTHPLHDPFVVGRVEAGILTSISIYDLNQDDLFLWQIGSATGAETITIPEAPSSVDMAALFPSTGDFYARPVVCQLDASDSYCERFAIGGRTFDIAP